MSRRLYLGCLIGATVGAMAGVPVLSFRASLPASLVLGWVVASLLPPAVGLAAGLLGGGELGADVDNVGVRQVPAPQRARWDAVVDLRAERYDQRTVVVLQLDSGEVVRLAAPYDGRWFAHDPAFENKLFTLRNYWETHRRWPQSLSDRR